MTEMAREAWTDERLDDLNQRVDGGFKEMREEFRALRTEIGEELRGINGEIAATNRVMAQLAWGMTGAILIGFLGTIAAILTQV
jgi:hypothetical protein